MTLQRIAVAAAVLVGTVAVGLMVRETLPPAAAQDPPAKGAPKAPPAVPAKVDGSTVSVATARPVVVKTVPAAGAADVDPALSEIKVTFSKDMMDRSWSWTQVSDDTFPKAAGDNPVHYEKDKRTCVMKVKLEPGKTYVIWLNSDRFVNFKDADARPAVPYLLVFQTKKAD
jgi:RNA polymerase sigma-70 factor (ECF subfamily)